MVCMTPPATSERHFGVARLIVNPHVRRCFLRPSLTEAPSLHRHYSASSVLRTSPPPQTARPISHELPVDPLPQSPLGLPVLRLVSSACMPSPLPRQIQWSLFARLSPWSAAFPVKKSGRLLPLFFRGLLSVHSRYGLHARRVA